MIALLPMGRVIAAIAVVYAAVVAGVLALRPQEGILASVGIAFSGATILQLVLMAWFFAVWRKVWACFPWFGRNLFPNIEGEWRMMIHWQGEGRSGEIEARAIVRQTFLALSMEVHSPGSDSRTLIAQPRRDPESSRALVYYVYHVEPKAIGSDAPGPYSGSAILRYYEEDGGQLRGNYWTSQQTKGHFVLVRLES